MSKTFEEQIAFLKNRLEVVPLSRVPGRENPHFELSKSFEGRRTIDEHGHTLCSSLEGFIIGRNALGGGVSWEAKTVNDSDSSRIYLVIDKEALTGEDGQPLPQIAFYFGICSGLVLNIPERTQTPAEETLMRSFVDCLAIKDKKKQNMLMNRLDKMASKVFDQKKVDRIRRIAERQNEIRKDRKKTAETAAQSLLGYQTYPGIELTHFVKNYAYKLPEEIQDFSLGEFVFWECLWDKLKGITDDLGVQFLYLFAADHDLAADPYAEELKELKIKASKNRLMDIASDETEINEAIEKAQKALDEAITGKLVSYYRRNFGFNLMKTAALIKPPYDESCVSMSTSFTQLRELRELKWDALNRTEKRRRAKKKPSDK